MKRYLATAAAALCAFVMVSCGSKSKAPELAPLHVEGTTLYAGEEPVRLKGVSFGWHNIWPRFYNEGAVREVHDVWGADLIRAAIGADDHAKADNPGIMGGYMSEPEFALEKLFAVVDGAVNVGCYVIVDWHSHVLYKEEAKEFFTKVATRYADCPNVIYELFNEPVSIEYEKYGDYSQPSDESLMEFMDQLNDYARELIETITSISNVHPLILMGCPQWDQDIHMVPQNRITTYDNLMYTVHYYSATHKDYLRDRASYAISQGVPVFLSECAGCEASGDGYIDVEEWENWDKWASDNDVSTVVWSISDKNETCSMLTPLAESEGNWDDAVLKRWGRMVKDWLSK